MLSLSISQNGDQPLADQIVAGIKRQIHDRHLRPAPSCPRSAQLREHIQGQPLHRGRGLRPPGCDGLSAVAPRLASIRRIHVCARVIRHARRPILTI